MYQFNLVFPLSAPKSTNECVARWTETSNAHDETRDACNSVSCFRLLKLLEERDVYIDLRLYSKAKVTVVYEQIQM